MGKRAETLVLKKGRNERDQMLDRLRASKAEAGKQTDDHGFASGVHWAKTHAGYEELVQLAGMREIEELLPERAFFAFVQSVINPEADCDESRDFWEMLGIEAAEYAGTEDVFVLAFIRGALEIWDDVADEL